MEVAAYLTLVVVLGLAALRLLEWYESTGSRLVVVGMFVFLAASACLLMLAFHRSLHQ